MLTIQNPSMDPFYNQAFEEFVFTDILQDDVFFLWQNAPSVIVGCSQNICREVCIRQLYQMQIPVVRRISGGGTVYHDLGNVNYTYITAHRGLDFDLLQPIVAALNAIGVPCQRGKTSELMIGDLKISGSAQRISGGRVLHHGTLLFESDLEVLHRLTGVRKNPHFSGGVASQVSTVTNIRPHLKRDMELSEFCQQLLAQFPVQYISLTDLQYDCVRRLRDEKYKTWAWTWGRTPAFRYQREGCLAGKPISVVYRVKNGIVTEGEIKYADIRYDMQGLQFSPQIFFQLCQTLSAQQETELFDFLM